MNKVWFSVLSAVAGLSLGALSAQAKVVGHFNGNGAFAGLGAYDGNGKSGLYVSQGSNNGSTSTFLNVYTSSCDYATGNCQGISGFGVIPNGDFNVSQKNASLATNTSSNANFTAVKWTYNYSTSEYSETPTSLGVITVSWKSSGDYSYKSIGSSTITYLTSAMKSVGQFSSSDALATGAIGGTPVNADYASIGSNSNNDIIIERK